MSTQDVKEFLDKINRDEALRDELTSVVKARDDKEAAAAEVAARHGFEFGAEELKRILDAAQGAPSAELTEEELDAVAAGLAVFQQIRFAPPYVPVGPSPNLITNPESTNPDIGG
jgi:predicted ribosomally synthesized peptide with nif11-like leader